MKNWFRRTVRFWVMPRSNYDMRWRIFPYTHKFEYKKYELPR
jgi:hypothetical protein